MRIATAVIAAGLSWQFVACGRGDIILGERGGKLAPAGSAGAGGASGTAAAGSVVDSRDGAAAGGGGGSVRSAGGANAIAGTASPAGTGGSVADAGGAPMVTRQSSGCGKEPVAMDQRVDVNGLRSAYALELPVMYDKNLAYPLVVGFRASDDSVEQFRSALNLAAVTGGDALLVYPNTLNDAPAWEFARDMPLVPALLSKLKAAYCIDEDRVFALGAGAGSLFVNLIGCVRADQVRAIAPLTGAPPPPGPCAGKVAVWLVQQGGANPMTTGAGLGNRDYWATRNACDVTRPMAVGPAMCVEFAGCDAGYPVRYCEYDGVGLPTFAASGAWDFFRML